MMDKSKVNKGMPLLKKEASLDLSQEELSNEELLHIYGGAMEQVQMEEQAVLFLCRGNKYKDCKRICSYGN